MSFPRVDENHDLAAMTPSSLRFGSTQGEIHTPLHADQNPWQGPTSMQYVCGHNSVESTTTK